tara:strand:- start:387 stop:623 length:237 start_codon:yes stop_codon:yes gene_type:complete
VAVVVLVEVQKVDLLMIRMVDRAVVVEMDIPLVIRLVEKLVHMVMMVELEWLLQLVQLIAVAVAVVPDPLVKLVLKVV